MAAPPNDLFANAQEIDLFAVPGSTPGTLAGSAIEVGESALDYAYAWYPAVYSVWYKFTAPYTSDISYQISIYASCSIFYVHSYQLYTGSSLLALTRIAQEWVDGGADLIAPINPVLVGGTEYHLRITGHDNFTLRWSSPPIPPDAPTVFVIAPYGATHTTCKVQIQANSSSGITGYVIQYKLETGEWQDHQVVYSTMPTITGLTPNTTYEFRCAAMNVIGRGPASAQTVVVTTWRLPPSEVVVVAGGGWVLGISAHQGASGPGVNDPVNDNWEDAIEIDMSSAGSIAGTLANSTMELGETFLSTWGNQSAWYKFTPSESGNTSIYFPFGTTGANLIGIYTGDTQATSSRKTQKFAPGSGSPLIYAVVAGVEYHIQVGDNHETPMPVGIVFTLQWNKVALPALPTLNNLVMLVATVVGGARVPNGFYVTVSANVLVATVVNLSSNNSAAIPPTTVTIPANSYYVYFDINTTAVVSVQTATITASLGTNTRTAILTVVPLSSVTLSSLVLSSYTVAGGTSIGSCYAILSAYMAAATTINLSSSDTTVATVPATVTVPVNSYYVYFTVTTKIQTENKSVTITATIGSSTAVRDLTVTGP